MRRCTVLLCIFLVWPGVAAPQSPSLEWLPEKELKALAAEISGETAKHHLEFLAMHHRMRGSRQFHAVAEYLAGALRSYGLDSVDILQFPADGRTFYGTQKARPAWDAEFAELWELKQVGGEWRRHRRIASWEAMPVSLAQDSESGEVTADLVDVGTGLQESDYAGKAVRGKLVLTSSQPGAVQKLAIDRFGAAGIISYAQNQRTAWWKENENFVRWGHLNSFAEKPAFAFMISLKKAREYRERLRRGDRVRLHAVVRAGRRSGYYDVITAVIPGRHPTLRQEEIAFSCHLDHQRPGANDNASGSVAILEVARSMAKLIREGRIERPDRTLRFIWPPEIEGTLALLNSRPDIARRIKAVIHMDMVGGGPVTKAIFHITRGPGSLPSFIYDVAETVGRFVNQQTDAFASGRSVPYPLISPEGGKEALQAVMADFSMGSDHQIYTEGSFRIPAIYLNDWPDRFIHTNFDVPANIDPTKLKRAAFIGAVCALFLANLTDSRLQQEEYQSAEILWEVLQRQSLRRLARMMEKKRLLSPEEADNLARYFLWYEEQVFESQSRFFTIPGPIRARARLFYAKLRNLIGPSLAPEKGENEGAVYRRNPAVKGPMSGFGYNYFTDHYGEAKARAIRVFGYRGLWGSGSQYAYEILNFVDGKRSVRQIRDLVAAEFGPIPTDIVREYLEALESIGVIERVR